MGNYISSVFGRPSDDGRGLFSRWVRKRQDLTVAMDEEAGTGLPFVDRRRVTNPRKVTLEAEAVKPPQQWKKREPYYKKAYEATTQHNRRLEEIRIDVKFQEEKLSEIRKSDKAVKEVI
jgi:sentrin-specific protease 1